MIGCAEGQTNVMRGRLRSDDRIRLEPVRGTAMAQTTEAGGAGAGAFSNRVVILFFSVLSMVAVANFQYGWTLFVPPLQKHLHAEQAAIQVTFTLFVLLETWLVPFEGWLVDKFGPRLLVIAGGILAGLGWVGAGNAQTLTQLYLAYAVAGIGAGVVYGTAIGSALKWFPDHRGLAAGLTAAGFGAGSALTVAPIANLIERAGYQTAFIRWGIIQGAAVVLAALFLKAPPHGWLPRAWKQAPAGELVKQRQTNIEFSSWQMAATPQFWVMYALMTLVATGGLMATAQLNPMAVDFKVDKVPVQFLFLTMPALQFALSADRVLNGICRPFWGWISDHIGRERTMALAFTLEACAIFCLIKFAQDPQAAPPALLHRARHRRVRRLPHGRAYRVDAVLGEVRLAQDRVGGGLQHRHHLRFRRGRHRLFRVAADEHAGDCPVDGACSRGQAGERGGALTRRGG